MIDHHRSAVYRAEDQWSSTLDRGGVVEFFGSTIDAPTQLRFGDIDHVRVYVEEVISSQELPEVAVRHRKGGSRAHYADGVIAIPSNEQWAMREAVVLHEIAHHACVSLAGNLTHDGLFTAYLLKLVESQLGSAAALLLRTGYQAAGVPIEVGT